MRRYEVDNPLGLITTAIDQKLRRKEAVERAKQATNSFVILLRLETEDSNASMGMGRVSPDDLVVNYAIFAPGTGKVKDQGRVYVRSYRGILGGSFPTGRTLEAQLQEAGRETANRVRAALQIGSAVIRH